MTDPMQKLDEVLIDYRSLIADLVEDRHSHGVTTEQLTAIDDRAKTALAAWCLEVVEAAVPEKRKPCGHMVTGDFNLCTRYDCHENGGFDAAIDHTTTAARKILGMEGK